MERSTTTLGKDAFHSVPKSLWLKEWDAVERVLTMKWRRA